MVLVWERRAGRRPSWCSATTSERRWRGGRGDGRAAQALALRCRIVLACAEGLTNHEVVARLGVNQATVSKWRRRFVASRLEGLHR